MINITPEAASQWVIAVCGVINARIICKPDAKVRRWAYVIGIVTSPAWVYTTIVNHQYGILILSLWYTHNFAVASYRHFWSRDDG